MAHQVLTDAAPKKTPSVTVYSLASSGHLLSAFGGAALRASKNSPLVIGPTYTTASNRQTVSDTHSIVGRVRRGRPRGLE